MSGVVGIDIGSADSIVASVGRGMVDIVRNEVSERVTPSVVAFTQRNRLLGDAAVSLIKSNFANTCRFPKLLLGKHLTDSDIEDERFFQLCSLKEAHDGTAGYGVSYLDQERVFSATEITAMLLTKLKETTENFTGQAPKDAVIACPSYFTDVQRKALLDAAEIAGVTSGAPQWRAPPAAAPVDWSLPCGPPPPPEEALPPVGIASASITRRVRPSKQFPLAAAEEEEDGLAAAADTSRCVSCSASIAAAAELALEYRT